MKIKFLADALVRRDIMTGHVRFRLLTQEARDWWSDNVGDESFWKEEGAFVVTDNTDAADIFMRMAEDGIRIATHRGVTVVGYIGAA